MCFKTLIKTRLREIRESKKLSRQQVSDATEIPVDTIKSWELARNRPTVENLRPLAEFYKVSLDYIAGITDNPEINQ